MTTFTLPLPETTNHAYATSHGQWYKTAKQKAWEDEAGWTVLKVWKHKKPLKDNVEVTLSFWMKRDRDIDGSIKPVLDLFQRMGVYENDKQINELVVHKFFTKDNPIVEVDIH